MRVLVTGAGDFSESAGPLRPGGEQVWRPTFSSRSGAPGARRIVVLDVAAPRLVDRYHRAVVAIVHAAALTPSNPGGSGDPSNLVNVNLIGPRLEARKEKVSKFPVHPSAGVV